MKDAVKKHANDLGIDEGFVLEKMKDIAETAKSDKTKLESLIEIGKLIGMYEQPTKEDDDYYSGVFLGEATASSSKLIKGKANELPEHLEINDADLDL